MLNTFNHAEIVNLLPDFRQDGLHILKISFIYFVLP